MCRELNSWLRVASTEAGASGSGEEVDSAQAPSRIAADVAARTEYLLCKGILLWRKVHVGSERSGKVGNTTPVYRTAQAGICAPGLTLLQKPIAEKQARRVG